MTGDLLASSLCKEEEQLRQNVEEWNQAALKLEMLMNELVSTKRQETKAQRIWELKIVLFSPGYSTTP